MDIIDEQGRLFGVVNIIDALVILLILAVVVAGAALVLQPAPDSDGPNLATVNATLDLGTQPEYIVAALNEGDTYSPAPNTRLTVTDVHLTPQDGQTRVIVRSRLQAPPSGDTISYGNAPPRLGRSLTIQTDTYQVEGTIRDIGGAGALRTDDTTVLLQTTLPASDAAALLEGQPVRVAGRTVATIDRVVSYETNESDQRLAFVRATLDARATTDGPRFGGRALKSGATITLPTRAISISGRILQVGGSLDTGTTNVLVTDTVPTETATDIEPGDSYRVSGRPVATVESVSVYGTQNPDRKRVAVGLSLSTLQYGDRPHFGPTAIRENTTVPFRAPTYEFAGTIERVGATEPRGRPATRTITLQLRGVPPRLANSIRAGMTETGGGETLARITSVERANATVVLVSDSGDIYEREHPIDQDLTLTADLQVRETATGVTFKGRTLQQGSTVVLDLGHVTVDATVVSLGS